MLGIFKCCCMYSGEEVGSLCGLIFFDSTIVTHPDRPPLDWCCSVNVQLYVLYIQFVLSHSTINIMM